MVSVVPSIIPILTANAVAANQVKRENKSLNNKEKKLKNSPLNDKINCRVFLNNGKVIEGHYEGAWYEDNSNEEGIWIKTDNGIEEINSKDYDRVEYYHKKTVNEAYIKAEKGNIYYTKNSDMFLSMVKSIFISKNIPVRVYYDTIKQMYIFGNAFDYIHADLATSMKYYSKIYGVDEMRANVSYLKENCALFQVLPDDNFKKYDMGDGYTQGWFLKIDDLYFACRNKEFHKSRDNVPLFKGLDWQWIPTDYYIAKKQGLTESIEDKILYIIRGVPGSGKSTLAHKLTDNVVEADQYFYDDEGNYNWSADKLNQAHNWCFYTVKKYMEEGRDKIAVANTFVKNKDYKRYVELAKEFGYKVDIRTCTGNYQNIHNVPDETVEKMRSKFQETPLDEELIHMEKSNYEDYYAVILKNPSRKELRDNNLKRSRIINFANDIWLFFDSMQWIHEEVLDNYAKQYGKAKNSGFYDYDKNQFVFIHSTDDNEEQVFKKYEIEDKKWLLSHPYIVNVFGNNINVKVIDEYWNSPWDIEQLDESVKYLNKEHCDTKIITSPYEMRDYIKNHKNIRIVYDDVNKWYFVNDIDKTIHAYILDDAISAGYYDDYGVSSGNNLLYSSYYKQFLLFIVSDNYNESWNEEGYKYAYKYDSFVIYDRHGEFKETTLYQVLGNPLEKISMVNNEQIDESAENDKTLRDYAVKLANICLDALVKTKYETRISKEQIQINVDKAFKKAVPMLKNSPYEYFIILVSKNDEPNASYGKTVDRKYGLITLPVFSKDPIDQTLSILHKHKSMLNKLYSTYSGDELKLKLNEYAIKYLKKELEKSLSNVRSKYLDILIHECTHLLDDVRRTKTYKSKEQNLKDDKGIEDYYNSPEEQNAFYQETVSIFDEWANQSVGYKTFDIFWDDFIRQYRGEYNMLNDKNKRKLKKRAYAYWYVYMKD